MEICRNKNIDISHILKRITLELDRLNELENRNTAYGNYPQPNTDIYLSVRLKSAFERAHEIFNTNYLNTLDIKHIVYTIFFEDIVDTKYILKNDPTLMSEIANYIGNCSPPPVWSA